MELHSPLAGLAAVLLVLYALERTRRPRSHPSITFSRVGLFKRILPGHRDRSVRVLFILRGLALLALALALARPRTGTRVEEVLTPGVDIVITLDLSGSMQAEDMGQKNRFQAAQDVIKSFVSGRKHDRIALVVFAATAFTQCPLTLDYGLINALVDQLKIGLIKEDGTAIGMGLATAVSRLKESDAKSKVIILVTDGRSNAGRIEPETAAELARKLGIKVYPIGVGGHGPARIPVVDAQMGIRYYATIREDLNEKSLNEIAEQTGGKYFRAADDKALENIFQEISAMEKTEIKTRSYHLYTELFLWPLSLALILLTLEILLENTIFRRIP